MKFSVKIHLQLIFVYNSLIFNLKVIFTCNSFIKASAAFFLLVCVVYIHAYRPHRPTTPRPMHPWRPTRPSPHRPLNKRTSNYNVNVNTNKNRNDNAMLASLMSQLLGNQDNKYPCTGGWPCYEKKVSPVSLVKSEDSAAAAAAVVEPAATAGKVVAAEEDATATAAATAGDFDFNMDQFAQFQNDEAAEFDEESEDDDVMFSA
jgi:hypothetical protein